MAWLWLKPKKMAEEYQNSLTARAYPLSSRISAPEWASQRLSRQWFHFQDRPLFPWRSTPSLDSKKRTVYSNLIEPYQRRKKRSNSVATKPWEDFSFIFRLSQGLNINSRKNDCNFFLWQKEGERGSSLNSNVKSTPLWALTRLNCQVIRYGLIIDITKRKKSHGWPQNGRRVKGKICRRTWNWTKWEKCKSLIIFRCVWWFQSSIPIRLKSFPQNLLFWVNAIFQEFSKWAALWGPSLSLFLRKQPLVWRSEEGNRLP